jgi:membrane-associated phospholipid phosphatase
VFRERETAVSRLICRFPQWPGPPRSSSAVFQRRYEWKAGVPTLAAAAYVAASRLSDNRHYLSDVIFGAVGGLSAGRTVTFERGSTRFELVPLAAAVACF